MNAEDQTLRKTLGQCADSFTCAMTSRRMRKSDSMHFAELYAYVRQHGWPSIEEGSLYASVLAIHDHEHHEYYISVLKEAVAEGKAPLELLDMLLQWRRHSMVNVALKQYLDTAAKRVFDVSSMIRDVLPSFMPRIVKLMRERCARYYLVYESPENEQFSGYMDRTHAADHQGDEGGIITRFANELQAVCPQKLHKGLWEVSWLPGERETLTLYLVW